MLPNYPSPNFDDFGEISILRLLATLTLLPAQISGFLVGKTTLRRNAVMRSKIDKICSRLVSVCSRVRRKTLNYSGFAFSFILPGINPQSKSGKSSSQVMITVCGYVACIIALDGVGKVSPQAHFSLPPLANFLLKQKTSSRGVCQALFQDLLKSS